MGNIETKNHEVSETTMNWIGEPKHISFSVEQAKQSDSAIPTQQELEKAQKEREK